ncbi:MAG: hypothetical protein ACM30G_20070 [Micromonosporaceae bacterium]
MTGLNGAQPDQTDPIVGPHSELRARILAKIAGPLGGAGPTAEEIADAVMGLFYTVVDDWDQIDVTEFRDDGRRYLDQRWLVARVPVQAQNYERIADRSVVP